MKNINATTNNGQIEELKAKAAKNEYLTGNRYVPFIEDVVCMEDPNDDNISDLELSAVVNAVGERHNLPYDRAEVVVFIGELFGTHNLSVEEKALYEELTQKA